MYYNIHRQMKIDEIFNYANLYMYTTATFVLLI